MIKRFRVLQDYGGKTMPNLNTDLPVIGNSEEWNVLKQLSKVLKAFDEATRELSVDNNCLCFKNNLCCQQFD
jgi:hypothetical protein